MKRLGSIILTLVCISIASAQWAQSASDDMKVLALKSPEGVPYALFHAEMQDTVAVALAFACGIACDSTAQSVGQLAPLAAVVGGANGMSPSETIEALKDFGAEFKFSPNSDQTYLSLAAPLKGIDGAATLANKILTNPNLPEAVILRLGAQMANLRLEQNNDMESKGFAAFVKAGMDAPAYEPFFRPEPEPFRHATQAQLKAWLAAHLYRKGIAIAVTGNIDAAHAGALIDKLLAGIPELGPEIAFPPVTLKVQDGRVITVPGDGGQQVELNFGSISERPKTLQEWYQGELLTSIFASGMKSRLFTDIRLKLGATYGLMEDHNFFEDFSMNRVRGRVAADKLDAVIAQLKVSWNKFADEGPTDAEIADAKNIQLSRFAGLYRNHLSAAENLRDSLTGHWTADDLSHLYYAIEFADLHDKALLKKLFPPNPIIVVVQ